MAALLSVLCLSTGCTNNSPKYSSIDGFAQGSTFHLVYREPDNGTTINLPDSLSGYFTLIDNSLSGYNPNSAVSAVNRGESPVLDSLFIECFDLSEEMYRNTNGLFDISAAPLFDIWGFGFNNRESVTQGKIDSIMAFVGMDKLTINRDTATKTGILEKGDPRMKVNFNAIAQGYTCDFICRKLQQMGISDYLLEVGGEILCKGKNPKGKEWSIGIDKPVDGNFTPGEAVEAIIEVSDKGVVTSGNYRKFYMIEGEKYSHTINPKNGYPVKHNLLSATVVAPTAAMADAYATYFMVIGLQEAIKVIEQNNSLEAVLVYSNNGQMQTYCSAGIVEKKMKQH